jgi:hypothetical protein
MFSKLIWELSTIGKIRVGCKLLVTPKPRITKYPDIPFQKPFFEINLNQQAGGTFAANKN